MRLATQLPIIDSGDYNMDITACDSSTVLTCICTSSTFLTVVTCMYTSSKELYFNKLHMHSCIPYSVI